MVLSPKLTEASLWQTLVYLWLRPQQEYPPYWDPGICGSKRVARRAGAASYHICNDSLLFAIGCVHLALGSLNDESSKLYGRNSPPRWWRDRAVLLVNATSDNVATDGNECTGNSHPANPAAVTVHSKSLLRTVDPIMCCLWDILA